NFGGWTLEGKPKAVNDATHARYHVASADYFRALGIPLLRGRFFTAADSATAPPVLLVNQAFARLYWPNEDAVNRRIDFGFGQTPTWTTIVGVVGDVKDQPNSPAAEPAFWWPSTQIPFQFPKMN